MSRAPEQIAGPPSNPQSETADIGARDASMSAVNVARQGEVRGAAHPSVSAGVVLWLISESGAMETCLIGLRRPVSGTSRVCLPSWPTSCGRDALGRYLWVYYTTKRRLMQAEQASHAPQPRNPRLCSTSALLASAPPTGSALHAPIPRGAGSCQRPGCA